MCYASMEEPEGLDNDEDFPEIAALDLKEIILSVLRRRDLPRIDETLLRDGLTPHEMDILTKCLFPA